jgi:hypothetical protein
MVDHDSFQDRGRALEEEYFRKKNRELVEKMRRDAADEQARQALQAQTGLTDPEAIRELQALGFTAETVALLPLMPVIRVAWAEGGVTDAERQAIKKLARARGIADGGPADRQLSEWLSRCPEEQVFTRAMGLIRAILDSPAHSQVGVTADDLVRDCETIAAASGGIFGLRKVSDDERALLSTIASQLKTRTR